MKCTDKEWQHCRAEKMGCNGCAYKEDKIEAGNYVRTKDGIICKMNVTLDKEAVFWATNKGKVYSIRLENITKYNKNILKLIKYGDVLKIKEDISIAYLGLTKPETTMTLEDIIEAIKEGKIELLEILTKEQFENNSYKVEEQ